MLKNSMLAAALAILAGVCWAAELSAVKVAGSGPILEPLGAFWNGAKTVTVDMLPQMVTTPTHADFAIKQLNVRAAHNGQWLAFLIEWKDETRNDTLVTDRFGDQIAVELPIDFRKDSLPAATMGNPGERVNVLQWRAAFQHDIDKGKPTVNSLYPNAVIDLYPDQVLQATDATPYMGGVGVDNPISGALDGPVLDQMAEGFGSLTVKPDQHANGKGVWKNGMWHVVITLPMATESTNSPRLSPGGQTAAAFAVWDGGAKEVGSRKAWSNWVPVTLAR